MIKLHDPLNARFADFDDWYYVAAAINDGTVLLQNGTVLTLQSVFDIARKKALALIAEKHAEMLTVATGSATAAERDTWIVKEREALAVIAGATTSDALKPVGDETLLQLAQKIAAKAATYRRLVGIADYIKRNSEKAVEALRLESVDDLTALDAVLETARQQAEAALAAELTMGANNAGN